jgi:hypothetical protein
MRRWQKFILGLLILLYVLPFVVIIWFPESQKIGHQIDAWLVQNNLGGVGVNTIVYYYAVVLAIILLGGLIILMFWPRKKNDLVLEQSASGTLSLDNRGITAFVNRALSGEGLENINVKVTNHPKRISLTVTASAPYRSAVIGQLDRIKAKLDRNLEELLRETNISTIKTKIVVGQSSKNKSNTRVI